MRIVVSERKDGTKEVMVLKLIGKYVGGPDVSGLDEKLFSAIGERKPCILNLEKCEWLGSSALSILIFHYKKFKEAGLELVLCSITDKIERILIISRLKEVFLCFDSEDEAYRHFCEAQPVA
ncbi:MAG: STAS domain-containing protein [Patescibacteria group bacterium]|jgi:anti-anti-sigma factor